MGRPSHPQGNRQAVSSIKLAKSSGFWIKYWKRPRLGVLICIYLHEEHFDASFIFRMTALLGVTELLQLLATSFRDSHVGSCQRVTPRKKLTLPWVPPSGTVQRWPFFLPRLPSLPGVQDAKQCHEGADVSTMNTHEIIAIRCLGDLPSVRPVLQRPSQTCWPPAPKCFAVSC